MAWTSEQDQMFSNLLDSDLPADTRRSAAAEIQEMIREDATNVPADKLRLAIQRCDIVTEAPQIVSAIADGCLVTPEAGADEIDPLLDGLYSRAAPDVARALAHIAVHSPAAAARGLPRIAQLLTEQDRYTAVTERRPGSPDVAATILPPAMAVCAFALVEAVYPPTAIRFLQSTVADCPGWDDSDADDPIRLPHQLSPVAVGTVWGPEPSRIESDIAVSLGWLGVQYPQLLPVIASWATGEYDDTLLRRIAIRALGVVARCDSPDGRSEVDICSTVTEIVNESDETSLRWLAANQVRACIGEEAAPPLADETVDVLTRTLAEATHRRREPVSEGHEDSDLQRLCATCALLLGRAHARSSPATERSIRDRTVGQFIRRGFDAGDAALVADMWVVTVGYVDARTETPWNRLLIAIEYSLLEGVRSTETGQFGRIESSVGRARRELGVMLEGGVTMYEGGIPAAVGLLDHRTVGGRQLGALVLRQHGREYAGLFTDNQPAKMPAVAAATPLLVRRVQNDPDSVVRGTALEALCYLCTYDATVIEPYLRDLAVGVRDEAPAVRCAYLDLLVCMLTDGMDAKGEAQQRRPPGYDAIRAAVPELGPLLQDHSLPVQQLAIYVLWLLCIYSPREGSKHLAQIQELVAHENDTVSRRAGMVLLYATTVSPDFVTPAGENLESVISDSSREIGCRIAAGATLTSLATVDGDTPRKAEAIGELAGLIEAGADSDDDDILGQVFELAAIRPSIAGAVLPALEPSLSSYVEAVRESSGDEAFDSDGVGKIGRISEIISTVCGSPDSDVDGEALVRFREVLREVVAMDVAEIEPEVTSALNVLPPE